jgi:hypothetical protein
LSRTSPSQRRASQSHRRRAVARGLVRVEVTVSQADAALIRALADGLKHSPERAAALRSSLRDALAAGTVRTAFDVFGSDLPDEAFEGVFDGRRREDGWRAVDL